MADHDFATPARSDSKSLEIDRLRNVSQQHLQEIDEEKIREQRQEIEKMQELERYAKHKRREKAGTEMTINDTPLPKMRSAQGRSSSQLTWSTSLNVPDRYSQPPEVGRRSRP